MSKAKSSKAGPSQSTGLYKSDSIKDVAESLGITSLSDTVASALASDVEYRIHQVVEEASRFMRHARRTTLTTSDIDQALRVLNIEPLYGHTPHNPPTFRRALPFPTLPTAGPVYFVEDQEIDFDRVLKEERLSTNNGGVRWTAHWLAVEGVQPHIPENPPALPKEDANSTAQKNGVNGIVANLGQQASASPAARRLAASQQQQQQLVKQVLSRELQLYHSRLTSTLLSTSTVSTEQAKRTAALVSLRHDAGLQPLLPYLVRWVGEGIMGILKEGADTGDDKVHSLRHQKRRYSAHGGSET